MINRSAILFLHRIGKRDDSRISANQNMVVTPNELERLVSSSRKKGWSFISLDELMDEYVRRHRFPSKTLSLTFDDGYLDNFSEAYPLLKNLNVPFCIYVTTGFIGQDVIPWWYLLEMALSSDFECSIPEVKNLSLDSLKGKNDAFMAIRSKIMSNASCDSGIKAWLDHSADYAKRMEDRLFMNWDDIDVLAGDKLVTLGAHTHTHPVLSKLDNSDSYTEIELSKELLESRIRADVSHFAYPFGGAGDFSARDIQYLMDMGFKTAVTTSYGPIPGAGQVNMFVLPRVNVCYDFSLLKMKKGFMRQAIKNEIKRFLPYAD